MAKRKDKVILRIPKETTLKEYGISNATSSALTRSFAAPLEIKNDVPIHEAVLKMQNSIYITKEKDEKKTDRRLEKSLERLQKLEDGTEVKLKELVNSKEKYQSTVKLSHEKELELQRLEKKRQRRVSLHQIDATMDSKKARAAYLNDVSDVKVNTVKTGKAKKAEATPNNTDAMKMSDEIKKLRVSMTTPKSGQSVNVDNIAKNSQYLSPSSLFFAKELGWIEDDRPKRVNVESPLANYQAETDTSNEENFDTPVTTAEDTKEEAVYEVREMDLSEIQRLERKYKKEAELIRKQIEKQNQNSNKKVENITNVYDKLLGNSPAVQISKNKNTVDLSNLSKDIDISKIPSFVLEEQNPKVKKK
jgi:hypothetical protein